MFNSLKDKICFSNIKKNHLVIILAIMAAVIMIISAFWYVFQNTPGTIISNMFTANSYYASYEVTVISNKNRNVYHMQEWYQRGEDGKEKVKYIHQDFLGNEVKYIISDEKIEIINNHELNKITLESMGMNKTNLLSLSTYIAIVNNPDNKGYRMNKKNKDGNEIYEIEFDNNTFFSSNGKKINKIELTVKNSKPVFLTVYSGNEVQINIEYQIFKSNFVTDDMFV